MPNPRSLTLIGVLLMAVFALARFPAATAFAWFAPADVGAFGVDGTLWSGRARIISSGGLQFRNTEWELQPGQLLLGRIGGPLKTRWAGGFLEGTGYISFGGAYSLRDAVLSMDISSLEAAGSLGNIGGQLTAELAELDLVDGWPTRVIGTGELRDLSSGMMGNGAPQPIGDIGFEFNTAAETAEDVVTGLLRDTAGPLEIDGTLVLTPPNNYELKTRLRPGDATPRPLLNNLNFLGAPEPDGTYLFQLAGSL